MKKTVLLVVTVLVFGLMFSGIALANEEPPDVAFQQEITDMGEEDFVGKDLELEEGQMGITAVEADDEEDYVGKDLELEEGEMGITSVEETDGESFVGEDMELSEGEVGIVSLIDDAQDTKSSLPLYGGIFAAIAALCAFAYKKATA